VVVLNLVPQPGETAGFSTEQHLDVLCQHAPRLRVDAVIADIDSVPTPDRLIRSAGAVGARAYLSRVAVPGAPERHDPAALAEAFRQAIGLPADRDDGGDRGVGRTRGRVRGVDLDRDRGGDTGGHDR
jgi:hypothetical protein